MASTPNPLSEMGTQKNVVVSANERPNETFTTAALPGFKKAVLGRRAIRAFDGVPMPEEVMRDCLSDAILAPSASNLQSYEFYWVRDAVKKETLGKLCLNQPGATTAGDLIVVVSRGDLWKSHLQKLIDIMTKNGAKPMKGAVKDYYESVIPMLMKTDPWGFNDLKRRFMFWFKGRSEPTVHEPITRADHRVYGHVQASLAAANLMLSLSAHGYESCPMSGIDKRGIATLLGLPATAEITMVICAGTGKPEGLLSPRTRLPFDELVKEV